MTRFKGRDFSTLRQEMVEFVRRRVGQEWTGQNAADPMTIVVETLANLGDQLHFYIDQALMETDLATAQHRSSVYSLALREGYPLGLPRSGRLRATFIARSGSSEISLTIPKFHKIDIKGYGKSLYSSRDVSTVLKYEDPGSLGLFSPNSAETVDFVSGTLQSFTFTYSEIDEYSRVLLPSHMIDSELVELVLTSPSQTIEWTKVSDVVSSGLFGHIYSLEPTFLHGLPRLYICFPLTYRELFDKPGVSFTFRYIDVDRERTPTPFSVEWGFPVDGLEILLGEGVSGFRDYESVESVRSNFKDFMFSNASLVTKEDYSRFVRHRFSGKSLVFDIGDTWDNPTYTLNPRTIYVLLDRKYRDREVIRSLLEEVSSRSDLIRVAPLGKQLYTVLVSVKSDLLGTSKEVIVMSVSTAVIALLKKVEEIVYPKVSEIYHEIHKSTDSVLEADVRLVLGAKSFSDYDESVEAEFIPVGAESPWVLYRNPDLPSQMQLTSSDYDSESFDEIPVPAEILNPAGASLYLTSHFIVPEFAGVLVKVYS